MFSSRSLLVAVATLCACGSSQVPDVARYQHLTQQLTATVVSHRDAGSRTATLSDCRAEQGTYDGQARALVGEMMSISGGMDSCMMGFGDAASADFHSTCVSMQSALDTHVQRACPASDLSQGWAETQRHCDEMAAYLQREESHQNTLRGMMGGGMSGGSCHP